MLDDGLSMFKLLFLLLMENILLCEQTVIEQIRLDEDRNIVSQSNSPELDTSRKAHETVDE